MVTPRSTIDSNEIPVPRVIGIVLAACAAQALSQSSILSDLTFCPMYSREMWKWIVEFLGGAFEVDRTSGQEFATVPLVTLFTLALLKSVVLVGFIGTAAAKLFGRSPRDVMLEWSQRGWLWLCIPGIYEVLRLVLQVCGFYDAALVLGLFAYYLSSLCIAGCIAMIVPAVQNTNRETESSSNDDGWQLSRWVIAAIGLYTIVYTTMNWQLYHSLMLPHGDSAMYEEHLWNITHGKGFRSYLDQGLFLGEHIQVVHLFLLPFYMLWPSHLLLEFFESLALAAAAIPIFWITRRHTASSNCATLLAIAWLVYPPLQFMDIAIDQKTFRPMSFGITAILFGIDLAERGRFKSTAVCFLVALSAKEDFTLILGPLGLWLAIHAWLRRESQTAQVAGISTSPNTGLKLGTGLLIFSAAYLLLVTRVVILWFRNGEELHYARYFAKFGDSPVNIVLTMLTSPGLLFDELITISSANYLLALFVPLAFLPFLSPSRLVIAAPVTGLLCLNEIVKADPFPRHHFQGPILPILFWAAAAGLGNLKLLNKGRLQRPLSLFAPGGALTAATLVCLACWQGGMTQGISPLSFSFWDRGSRNHWSIYIPDERAEMIRLVLNEIPENSRVASTDFVHTRLTHYERSYDYSGYRRKVAGDQEGAPPDTEYIILDTKHHYSDVHSPEDVRELREEPENWIFLEELYEKTNRCFIVLKRRKTSSAE